MKFSEVDVGEEFVLPGHPNLAFVRILEQVIEVEGVYQDVNAHAVDGECQISYWYIRDKTRVEEVE